jgi:competence protein ComEC
MRPAPPPPLVPIAAAFIAGAACGGTRPGPIGAFAVAACALLAAWRLRRLRSACLLLLSAASAAAGAGLQARAWDVSSARLQTLFDGASARTGDIDGVVLAAPEARRDGTRSLLVRHAGARLRLDLLGVPEDDAARLASLRAGDRVRIWCKLRAPSPAPGLTREAARRRLAAQRLDATGTVKSSRLVALVARGPRSITRTLDTVHVSALERLDRALGPASDARSVLGAMLLGERGRLDPPIDDALRDAGLVHLLSISGIHTSMTVLLLIAALRRTGMRPVGVLTAGGASLVALALLVGNGAAVWRACGCLFVLLAARALSREVDALAALALSAGALVLAVPSLAWSLGFILSVLATAGLVILGSLERPPRGALLRRSLEASTGAYLATMPLLAATFGRLAPAGFLANLAAAPLCAACLFSGAAAAVTAGEGWAGICCARLAELSVGALLFVSRVAQAVPGGHLRVAPPAAALVIAFSAAGIGWWLRRVRGPSRSSAMLGILTAFLTIAMHLGPPPGAPGPARVQILDVGQGLAVVLRGPEGACALYDAGPAHGGRFDAGEAIVVPALLAQGCRRVEFLAFSHDHDDHAGGARAILRDLDVGALWLAEGSAHDPHTRELTEEAVAAGIAVQRLRRGDALHVSGLGYDVLHPGLDDRSRPMNDRCLAVRVRGERTAILLPGDLEAGGERSLVASGLDLRAEALVAPHHGADGSSTATFLEAVRPTLVTISAGAGNRFGHPGRAALARFVRAHALVVRTDTQGSVILTEDGGAWRVSVEDERGRDEGEEEDQRE